MEAIEIGAEYEAESFWGNWITIKPVMITDKALAYETTSTQGVISVEEVNLESFIHGLNSGLIRKKIPTCSHQWVDTGTLLVFCKKCNADGDLQNILKPAV